MTIIPPRYRIARSAMHAQASTFRFCTLLLRRTGGVLAVLAMLVAVPAGAQELGREQCGARGVWIQILGSGASELGSEQAGPSYIVWLDGHARLLVNTAPGSALRFSEAGADFADLEAIVYTQLGADHTSDLPAFLRAAMLTDRETLPILGPDGSDLRPSLEAVVSRLIGEDGAFPDLAGFLALDGDPHFRLSLREVPATGTRRWAQFGSEHVALSAIPVHHGPVPVLAWRAEIGERSLTFAGSFSNRNDVVAGFAQNSSALIVHHAITEAARGAARDLHVRPSQIGRIASQADVGVVILGARAMRTRGFQTETLDRIGERFTRRVILANDKQCLGLP